MSSDNLIDFKDVDLIQYLPRQKAGEAVEGLVKGCRLMGLTRGQFSLIDLIYEILVRCGRSSVIICSWSAGIKDARTVAWMRETNLIKDFCMILDASYKKRSEKYGVKLEELFGVEHIRTAIIHAKIVSIWNDDWKISIRSSMNLNANRTCENYEIDEGGEVWEFYQRFLMSIIKVMPAGFDVSSAYINQAMKALEDEMKNNSDQWYLF